MDRIGARRWGKAKLLQAGQLLKQMREDAGVTPKHVCSEIGINVGQLSDIERGIQNPSLRRVFQIAELLNVSPAEVVARVLQDRVEEAGFTNLKVHVETETPMLAGQAQEPILLEQAEKKSDVG